MGAPVAGWCVKVGAQFSLETHPEPLLRLPTSPSDIVRRLGMRIPMKAVGKVGVPDLGNLPLL